MVVEAHKALKKRRKRRKLSLEEPRHFKESHKTLSLPPSSNEVNIFGFLSKRQEGYSDLIKQLGSKKANGGHGSSTIIAASSRCKDPNRTKSCSDVPIPSGNPILNLDRSPRQKRRYSFSDRVTVAFSKSKNYLLGQESGLLLNEAQSEGDLEGDQERMYENQLDKEAGENPRDRGMGSFSGSRRTWDSKQYKSRVFQNANITFIDEEKLHNMDEEDTNDTKAKLSVTTDENMDSDTDSKEEADSESEESVFTTDGSDHCHSYEQLVEEYSKEDNTEP